MTNLQRMQEGLAPIGPDGRPINLHHMLQTQSGPIAEVTATMHQQYSRILHINPNTIPSGINRSAFECLAVGLLDVESEGLLMRCRHGHG
jgi:filamentous hemagglutinin